MTRRVMAAALFLAFAASYFAYHLERLEATDPYREAVAFVRADPELARVLGTGVEVGYFPGGSIDREEDEAHFSIPVRGPAGGARVRVALERIDRQWRLVDARYAAGGATGVLVGVDVERLRDAQEHSSSGYALYVKGRFADALAEFDVAVAGDSANATTLFWRGQVLTELGRRDRATADFERAVALDPGYDDAHYALGVAYGRAGDYARSLRHLDRAIALGPADGIYYYSRAVTRIRLGREAEARQDFEEACARGYDDGCAALEQWAR